MINRFNIFEWIVCSVIGIILYSYSFNKVTKYPKINFMYIPTTIIGYIMMVFGISGIANIVFK